MNTTINYNGQEYIILSESEDKQGAGSIKDLADDFAFEVATQLQLRYGTTKFNEATRIIRKIFYQLITDSILNILPLMQSPERNLKEHFPPENKEFPIWLS